MVEEDWVGYGVGWLRGSGVLRRGLNRDELLYLVFVSGR